ncbi:MAG: hypothetical protein OXF31_10265 [Gammaproteobacteria bacterium]|nr:hypothetical protein [Gammaproteobacteria bacterium]
MPTIKINAHFQRSDISDLGYVWQEDITEAEIQWGLESMSRHLSVPDLPKGQGGVWLRAFGVGFVAVAEK